MGRSVTVELFSKNGLKEDGRVPATKSLIGNTSSFMVDFFIAMVSFFLGWGGTLKKIFLNPEFFGVVMRLFLATWGM